MRSLTWEASVTLQEPAVPNYPLFSQHYPGAERFALLCEGDLAGYEAAILGRWRSSLPHERQFDIWPCGTSEGLISMADAIGRSVRIAIIEDRDSRTPDVAQQDCRSRQRDRESRGIAMRIWTTWDRNEIENFFLDDAILIPAMSSAFACSDDDVTRALSESLVLCEPFQALQLTISKYWANWKQIAPKVLSVGGRFGWNQNGPVSVDAQQLVDLLKSGWVRWTSQLGSMDTDCKSGATIAGEFEANLRHARTEREAASWRDTWCGKELLRGVRELLSSQFAAPKIATPAERKQIPWHACKNNSERAALDRAIEREIQPQLVGALWRNFEDLEEAPIGSTFDRVEAALVL